MKTKMQDGTPTSLTELEKNRRWRLILGKHSETSANKDSSQENVDTLTLIDQQRDTALDYLYQREYENRRKKSHNSEGNSRYGGQDITRLTPAIWLSKVRRIFPKSTIDILQKQAIERYHLTSLLSDAQTLQQATPTIALVQTLLTFKDHLSSDVKSEVRRIIATVCYELEQRLSQKVLSPFSSRRLRHLHGGKNQLSNLDWSTSIRRNLGNYVVEEETIILENLYFYKQQQNRVPWNLYIVIDQSGSMCESIIHSAVLAAIFCKLRSLNTHLILFDTSIVDLSNEIGDPVETLLAVQLGGGTDIGAAMHYTANKISQPQRSIVILISDFYEGGDPNFLYTQVKNIKDSGVRMLGLAALDQQCDAAYDEETARELIKLGMPVAAMTPEHLAHWVADNIR
jgi:hypothetical protein